MEVAMIQARHCRCECGTFLPSRANQWYRSKQCKLRMIATRQKAWREQRKGAELPAGRPCPVCDSPLEVGKVTCSWICNGKRSAKIWRAKHWKKRLAGMTTMVEAFNAGRRSGFSAGYGSGYRRGFNAAEDGQRPTQWLPSKRPA